MTSTLSHFWQLASSSKEERLRSAHALVKGLVPKENGESSPIEIKQRTNPFENGLKGRPADQVTDSEVREAELALESAGNSELVYALKRLIKGLASHRESARVGFSVALCELLSQNRIVLVHHALTLILAYSTSAEKVRGQEERDMIFARMFGILALIRSGLLTDSNAATEDDFHRAIEILWGISNGKHWLRESATSVIVQCIQQLCSVTNPPSWKSDALKWLVDKICTDKRVTSDSIAIFMTLKECAPKTFTSAQRLPHFANQEILATANLPTLARILRDASVDDEVEDEEDVSGTGKLGPSIASGSTQAHFVWDMILKQYASKSEKASETKQASFPSVFRILVDENLFAITSSHQKKAWGLQVMQRALILVDISFISDIFTPNLMRTLMNQLSAKNPVLHKAAKKTCIDLQQSVKERPAMAYSVFFQLTTSENGNLRFDSVTSTKTVETILQFASSKDVRKIADQLIQMACEEGSNGKRISLLDLLLVLIRNQQIGTDDECTENIITFFAAHGIFKMKKSLEKTSKGKACLSMTPKNVTSSLQSSCRSKFLSCLADLSISSTENDIDWIQRGSQILLSLDQDSSHFVRLPKTQHEILKQAEKSIKSLQNASKKADIGKVKRMSSLKSFIMAASLYAQAAQQEEEEVNGLMEPIIEFVNQSIQETKTSSDIGDAQNPGPMDLFVDCLSNALQQPSAFLRSMATQTFDSFADQMTHSSMQLLLEQLGFNQQDEKDSEEDADEEAEDEDEDDEGFMSDSMSVDSSADSMSDVDEEDVDKEFAAQVREALKSGGVAEKDEEEEEDEEDEEEDSKEDDDDESDSSSISMENFDDEQMMLMDDKLADIFRQKHTARKQEDEARKEEVKSHIRIIDLLDHFAHRQSENGLCVETVLPLLTIAMEKEKALDQLRQRATTVLRKTLLKGGGNASKLNVVGKPSMTSAIDALNAIHKLAATNLPAEQMSLINSSNIYLTKTCLNERNVPDEIKSIYITTLNDFMERKNNNLKPSFLIDAFSRFPFLGFSLHKELMQASSGEQKTVQNAFRQIQVMEMLRGCVSNLIGQIQQQGLKDSKLIDVVQDVLKGLANLVIERTKKDQHRIKEILKCGLIYVRLSRKLIEQVQGKTGKEVEQGIQSIWPSSELESAMEALQTTNKMTNSASLQGLLKQMIALTKIEKKKENKRKNKEGEDAGMIDTSTETQSKSTTKNKKKKVKQN